MLQSGLTNRCDTTHDATIKLISGGWMKSAKFDPIVFLQKLYDTLQPLESEYEEESKNIVDETMISQIANISLIGPNNDDYTVEIKNLSLNVTNINDSSDVQNITSVSDNIMLDEELHDEDFEL